jgi:hypothetical protein
VSLAAGDVIIDACTLVSYHVVGRSDLLRQQFDGRAHWTETIQREVGRLGVADTDWLGAPIEVGGDNVAEIIEINSTRVLTIITPSVGAHLGEVAGVVSSGHHGPSWCQRRPDLSIAAVLLDTIADAAAAAGWRWQASICYPSRYPEARAIGGDGEVVAPAERYLDFANGSRAADPRAAAIYAAATGRGCHHPHAIRILARAWLRIIWRCWQDRTAFDPALHRSRHAAAA